MTINKAKAWSEPTQPPPAGNVNGPVWISPSSTQSGYIEITEDSFPGIEVLGSSTYGIISGVAGTTRDYGVAGYGDVAGIIGIPTSGVAFGIYGEVSPLVGGYAAGFDGPVVLFDQAAYNAGQYGSIYTRTGGAGLYFCNETAGCTASSEWTNLIVFATDPTSGITFLNSPSIFNGYDDEDFFINSDDNFQIRLDADQGETADNSDFGINNGDNTRIFTVDENGIISIRETTAVPSDNGDYGTLFVKESDGLLYFRDGAGNEYGVTQSGTGYWTQVTNPATFLRASAGGLATSGATLYGASANTHINLGFGTSITGENGQNFSDIVVLGGHDNVAANNYTTIVGGQSNSIEGGRSVILGGVRNSVTGEFSIIGSGYENEVSGNTSAIFHGNSNIVSGDYSIIGGGYENEVSGDYSVIGGGSSNVASGYITVIGGGAGNQALSAYSTILGGYTNISDGTYSAVVAGSNNQALEFTSFIGAGYNNTANSFEAAIISGKENTILPGSEDSIIGAGDTNTIGTSFFSIIGAGRDNTIMGSNYTILGSGENNSLLSSSDWSVIAGGDTNSMSSSRYSVISGGANNIVSGYYAAIPGGSWLNVGHGSFGFRGRIGAPSAIADVSAEINTFHILSSNFHFNSLNEDANFIVDSEVNDNALFVEGSTGNVGINTGDPEYWLDVVGDDSGTIMRVSDGVNDIGFYAGGGVNSIYSMTDEALSFGANGAQENLTVEIPGYVSVGDDTNKLAVINEEGDMYVENQLEVDGSICLNNVCNSSWPSGGGGGGVDCDFPKFVNFTAATYVGDVNGSPGYVNADAACAAEYANTHVCSTEEIMRSIRCGTAGVSPIFTIAGNGWINNGPPGSSTLANDCVGWTSGINSSIGTFWMTTGATGGVGYSSRCTQSRSYACCSI